MDKEWYYFIIFLIICIFIIILSAYKIYMWYKNELKEKLSLINEEAIHNLRTA